MVGLCEWPFYYDRCDKHVQCLRLEVRQRIWPHEWQERNQTLRPSIAGSGSNSVQAYCKHHAVWSLLALESDLLRCILEWTREFWMGMWLELRKLLEQLGLIARWLVRGPIQRFLGRNLRSRVHTWGLCRRHKCSFCCSCYDTCVRRSRILRPFIVSGRTSLPVTSQELLKCN